MPSLVIEKVPPEGGANKGHQVPLAKNSPVVIGRAATCGLVLNNGSVSREHVQIVIAEDEYYVEDLKSRNKTFLNKQPVEGRWPKPLKDGDRIEVCGFLLSYRDERKPAIPGPPMLGARKAVEEDDDEEDSSNTTVEATIGRMSSGPLFDTQPAEKLRAILEISSALGKTLDVKALLPQIADELFKVFKIADRCLIIQVDENKQLIPVVAKTRRPSQMSEQFSRTIIRRCLEKLEAILSKDAANDENIGISNSIAEFRIRSVMCVPLATQDGNPLGVIQLDTQTQLKSFTQEDLRLLACVAAQASIALENARLHETILSQQKLEQESKAATKVQLGFLPQSMPLLPGYEFFSRYMAARTVGGDYYDFITMQDGRQAVLLGDVSGKGVPAALLMARLSGEARVSMLTNNDLAQAITHLNNQLMLANLEDRYVTLTGFIIDPHTHSVDIVSAGHLSPLVYRAATKELEKVFEKESGDFPIGWVPGHEYSKVTVKLNPGDSIVVYSDGIEDAQPKSGERFLEAGVIKTITTASQTVPTLSALEIGNRIIQAVQGHVGTHPQFDDIALVCFGRIDPSLLQAAPTRFDSPAIG